MLSPQREARYVAKMFRGPLGANAALGESMITKRIPKRRTYQLACPTRL